MAPSPYVTLTTVNRNITTLQHEITTSNLKLHILKFVHIKLCTNNFFGKNISYRYFTSIH